MNVIKSANSLLKPLKMQPSNDFKKITSAPKSELAPIGKKSPSSQFSKELSDTQKDTLYQTLGYDQPSYKQQGALNAYLQISTQQKRDEIMESMGFHFIV